VVLLSNSGTQLSFSDAVVYGHAPSRPRHQRSATAAIRFIGINRYVGAFLAMGRFDAGFLGAICISLASSWAFGEVFGWAHSLNHKVKEAPWFCAYYFFDLLPAGTVALIPRAPLVLFTLFVQVIAVTLYPCPSRAMLVVHAEMHFQVFPPPFIPVPPRSPS
jgi:hypothetical protein